MATNVVIVDPSAYRHPGEAFSDHFRKIGIAELVFGGVVIVFQLISIIILLVNGHGLFIDMGIWGGILFCVTGGLALASSKNPNQCNVIAGMILAIISLLYCIGAGYSAGARIAYFGGTYFILFHIITLICIVGMFVAAIFHIVFTSKSLKCC